MPPLDFSTAITIILAALAALLAALAIFIGIVAAVGWFGLRDEVKKIATATAERTISEYLEKGHVKDKLRTEVLPKQVKILDEGVKAIPYTGEEEKSHADNEEKPE